MRGIILAGGAGTRLHPMTIVMSKQLLPVYDKPMIYYPLSTLLLAGIREILIISTPQDLPNYQKLLGNGEKWGILLSYLEQPNPGGLAQAYTLGADFVGGKPSALILGDNIFHGIGLQKLMANSAKRSTGASVFAYQVKDPERYGVVSFDEAGNAKTLVEKPADPQSNWAVTGLYFYDGLASEYAANLKPSPRGELEITDLNKVYMKNGNLNVELLESGFAWLDTGTPDSLSMAGEFIRTLENRQGSRIGSPEETAFHMGFITPDQLANCAKGIEKSDYGKHLLSVAENAVQIPNTPTQNGEVKAENGGKLESLADNIGAPTNGHSMPSSASSQHKPAS